MKFYRSYNDPRIILMQKFFFISLGYSLPWPVQGTWAREEAKPQHMVLVVIVTAM
jgi:hypothetical protein